VSHHASTPTQSWAVAPAIKPVRWSRARDLQIRQKYRIYAGICLLFIGIGLYFRLSEIERVPGINGDEAWYGVQAQRVVDQYLEGQQALPGEKVNFRTPTGNFWNPFLMIPRIILELTGEPSLWRLRLPAAITGVLTLLVNYWLCRRATNRTLAWTSTLILAILPVNIAYSRIAWDASQTVLFCLPAIYLPLIGNRQSEKSKKYLILTGLSLVCAIIVHPTNLFMIPVTLWLSWPLLKYDWGKGEIWCAAVFLGVIIPVVLLSFKVFQFTQGNPGFRFLDSTSWNIVVLQPLWGFCRAMLGLFTGESIYTSMSHTELGIARFVLLTMSLFMIWGIFHYILTYATVFYPTPMNISCNVFKGWETPGIYPIFQRLFYGLILAIIPFYCLAASYFAKIDSQGQAGPQAGYERYALWLVAPLSLMLAIVLSHSRVKLRWEKIGVYGVRWALVPIMLGFFYQHYWLQFAADNQATDLGHETYRTGLMDPRMAKWQELKQQLQPGEIPHIIYSETEQSWWYIWTLKYLSYKQATWERYNDPDRIYEKKSKRQSQLSLQEIQANQSIWWLVEKPSANPNDTSLHYDWQVMHRPNLQSVPVSKQNATAQ
jgi:hypothetical protein